jgi:hypothetical protein
MNGLVPEFQSNCRCTHGQVFAKNDPMHVLISHNILGAVQVGMQVGIIQPYKAGTHMENERRTGIFLYRLLLL